VVKLLLEKGTVLETKDVVGWTLLLIAAENGHKAVVQQLLEHSANVNVKDNK
jgi:ankyrin repeat protein